MEAHLTDLMHVPCCGVYRVGMNSPSQRLDITLDEEHAVKLAQLAERVHVNEGALARSLLCSALDASVPDPANVVGLLDAIDGAYDRAQLGLGQAAAGETVVLDQL